MEPLEYALAYASLGWRVAPAARGEKHPYLRNWQDEATVDEAAIRGLAWHNVCVVTGEESNLWVLDVDLHHDDGYNTVMKLEDEHAPLPATYTVGTGSGGAHLYWTWEGVDFDLRNSAGKLGPGLDTRGEGGQVVAPPSRCSDGHHFKGYGVLDAVPAVAAPSWLLALLRPPVRPPLPKAAMQALDALMGGGGGWAHCALADECRRIVDTPEGGRNDALVRGAFRMGQLIASGDLRGDAAYGALSDAGREAGLPAWEVATTIESGIKAGKLQPRR